MKVLVAGAGGILGRQIVRSLNKRGIVPDGMAYAMQEFDEIDAPLARKLCCDVTKPQQLEGLLNGVETVISVIGITRLEAEITHMDVDYQGNLNLLQEAKKSGVKKFVFISPAGTEQGHQQVPLFRAKYLFEQQLQASGLSWLIFRSGGFYADLAGYGKTGAKGKLYVINNGINRFTPVDVTDVAEVMVKDALNEHNKVITVGGPEDMSWMQICKMCADALGKKVQFVNVPAWLCRVALFLIRPFSHKYYAMGQLLLYTSTHDLLTDRRGTLKFSDYIRDYYKSDSQ